MFNISDLISRAWKILWNYRVLWIFALLLALSGGTGSGGGGGGGGTSSWTTDRPSRGSDWFNFDWGDGFGNTDMPQWLDESLAWFEQTVIPMFATEESAIRTVVALVAILIGISLVVALLLALVRYPSETAVMRLVDEYEHSGTRRSGFRLDFSGIHCRHLKGDC